MPGDDGDPRLGLVPLLGELLLPLPPLLSLVFGAPEGRRLPPGGPAAPPLFSDGRCLSPLDPLLLLPLPPMGAACMQTLRPTGRHAAGHARPSKIAFSVRNIIGVRDNQALLFKVCF